MCWGYQTRQKARDPYEIHEFRASFSCRCGGPEPSHPTTGWLKRSVFEERYNELTGINSSALFQPRSRRQARWDVSPVHSQFSTAFQNLLSYSRSRSSSGEFVQFRQIRLKHPVTYPSCFEDGVLSSQLHYCRIALPHPTFSTIGR